MHISVDRRQFINGCLATSVAGVAALSGPVAQGIDPIARHGGAKFKFSLAAYSYRDLLTGDAPPLTLADFIDDCAKMALDGVELTSYYFPAPLRDDYLMQLKQQCFRLGLDVSGTAVGNDFIFPPGQEREGQIDSVKQWIDRAESLGAPVIRIFAGKPKESISAKQAHQLAVEAMQECCEYAGARGVHLALENHGGPTATPHGMLAFIHDVKSPWFGVNVDTGNFFSETPYDDLKEIAPYALNVQVKAVTSYPEKQNKKPTDFARLASMLRDVGYRGYIVFEFEEDGNPRTECGRYLNEIRQAFS